MSSQTESAIADVTSETFSVEEIALCAQSLHYIHPLGTEVTNVTATESRSEVLTCHALRRTRPNRVTHMVLTYFPREAIPQLSHTVP